MADGGFSDNICNVIMWFCGWGLHAIENIILKLRTCLLILDSIVLVALLDWICIVISVLGSHLGWTWDRSDWNLPWWLRSSTGEDQCLLQWSHRCCWNFFVSVIFCWTLCDILSFQVENMCLGPFLLIWSLVRWTLWGLVRSVRYSAQITLFLGRVVPETIGPKVTTPRVQS